VSAPGTDKVFSGSIAKFYEDYMVPLIFQPYAADIAKRLAARPIGHLLEVAAGTGVVTRALAATLPGSTSIVATDLNQAMLDQAAAVGTSRPVEWRQADVMKLPFGDAAFDAVVCQFGVMFFPDKPKAFAEVHRVLKPGGIFVFNVWDRIEANEFADVVTQALAVMFPQDPPRFMARTPHGYHDKSAVERDLAAGGFTAKPAIDTVAARSKASSPEIAAMAYCQGTPLRSEIEARGGTLDKATAAATEAVAKRFGRGAVDGLIQAHVVAVGR
jgi:ubiquinone/menaquinone biosynthesis C-methylase UbiE